MQTLVLFCTVLPFCDLPNGTLPAIGTDFSGFVLVFSLLESFGPFFTCHDEPFLLWCLYLRYGRFLYEGLQ